MKFILFTFFLCNLAYSQIFIKESRYIYSGKDYIGSLNILSDLNDADKDKLLKQLEFTYKGIKIELKERDENYFKFTESRFYFGNHNKLNLIVNFINYPQNASQEFAKHICEEIPCDFIYEGNYITGYSFNKISLPKTKDYNYFFINKNASFNFDKGTPSIFLDMVLTENNSDVSYTGEEGKVLKYIPDHDDKKYDPTQGVFLVRNSDELFIASDYRFKEYLEKIVSFTNAECIIYRQDQGYYQCKRDPRISEDDIKDMGESIDIYFPNGKINLSMEEEILKDIYIDLNKTTTMSHAFVSSKIQLVKKGYKVGDSKISTHLKDVKLVYKRDNYTLATIILNGVSKENRDALHESITKYTDANIFEIYKLNPTGDLLLSKNSIEHFDEYNRMHDNRIFEQYKTFSFGVDVLSNEILASNSHRYLRRKKTPHISLIDATYTWWPSRKSWGVTSSLQYYKIKNSAVDSFGSTDEVGGSIFKLSFSALLRKLLRKEKTPTTVTLGAGGDIFNYNIDEANDAIGSLKMKSLHFF